LIALLRLLVRGGVQPASASGALLTTHNDKESPPCKFQPYLFFDGRCEEAVEFYRRALGAEVTMLMRFKESPDPPRSRPAARTR